MMMTRRLHSSVRNVAARRHESHTYDTPGEHKAITEAESFVGDEMTRLIHRRPADSWSRRLDT